MRERKNVEIRGRVQGVFFRETVRRIASKYDVHGFVRNAGGRIVEIEAEGEPEVVNAFIEDVLANPPADARVEDVRSSTVPVMRVHGFSIAPTLR
ncbi:MAG: acylphosphatase [Candidatus Tumulicola sp.]